MLYKNGEKITSLYKNGESIASMWKNGEKIFSKFQPDETFGWESLPLDFIDGSSYVIGITQCNPYITDQHRTYPLGLLNKDYMFITYWNDTGYIPGQIVSFPQGVYTFIYDMDRVFANGSFGIPDDYFWWGNYSGDGSLPATGVALLPYELPNGSIVYAKQFQSNSYPAFTTYRYRGGSDFTLIGSAGFSLACRITTLRPALRINPSDAPTQWVFLCSGRYSGNSGYAIIAFQFSESSQYGGETMADFGRQAFGVTVSDANDPKTFRVNNSGIPYLLWGKQDNTTSSAYEVYHRLDTGANQTNTIRGKTRLISDKTATLHYFHDDYYIGLIQEINIPTDGFVDATTWILAIEENDAFYMDDPDTDVTNMVCVGNYGRIGVAQVPKDAKKTTTVTSPMTTWYGANDAATASTNPIPYGYTSYNADPLRPQMTSLMPPELGLFNTESHQAFYVTQSYPNTDYVPHITRLNNCHKAYLGIA